MTEQEKAALVALCKAEIRHFERCVNVYPHDPVLKHSLLIHKIALAALTTPPAPAIPETIGWLRKDVYSERRMGDAPVFILGQDDPSTVWDVKYIPLAALREQKIQPAQVAVPDTIKQILLELRTYNPKADNYGGKHIIPGWADRIEKALCLNSGSKPQRFVVKRPGFFHTDQSTDLILGKQEKDWEEAVRAAGGEIAE